MKYTRQLIGKTNINISGKDVNIELWRNEDGNIERFIPDEESLFPHGTCLEGYNEDMVITECFLN